MIVDCKEKLSFRVVGVLCEIMFCDIGNQIVVGIVVCIV